MADKKKLKRYGKRELIKEVAEELNIYPSAIEEVYNTLEKVINDHLLEVEEDCPVEVKVFDGIKFSCKFIPEHYHSHPQKGYTLVDDKIKYNCSFSATYKADRIAEYHDSKKMLHEYLKERQKFAEQWEAAKQRKQEEQH